MVMSGQDLHWQQFLKDSASQQAVDFLNKMKAEKWQVEPEACGRPACDQQCPVRVSSECSAALSGRAPPHSLPCPPLPSETPDQLWIAQPLAGTVRTPSYSVRLQPSRWGPGPALAWPDCFPSVAGCARCRPVSPGTDNS